MTLMSVTPSNVRVVGIAGASNGGKTTICARIKNLVKWQDTYHIVHMDDYYWPRNDSRHKMTSSGTMLNFDCMEAVDWDSLIKDIDKILSNSKIVAKYLIIEGIFACTHPEISKLLHSRIFLTLDYETMRDRRSQREYEIPDQTGYFDEYVYPCYLDTLGALKDDVQNIPVHFIEGSKDRDHVFNHVMTIIHQENSSTKPSKDGSPLQDVTVEIT